MLELSCYNHGFITKKISTNSTAKIRSSYQTSSGKKCILRNFAEFTGKGLCQPLFFHKIAGLRPSINTVFTELLRTTASEK